MTKSLPESGRVPAHAARAIASAAAGGGIAHVPGRRLDQGELLALAAAVALRPDQWQHEMPAESDGERHYACLYRDEHVDVWLLCWSATGDTGWHDHDVSSGAVAVARGRLVEHNLAVGRPEVRTEVAAAQVYSFGPDHIHRLTGLTGPVDDAVSIHAYSPPLQTLGQYVVDDNGVLHRTSVTYAEELRAPAEVGV